MIKKICVFFGALLILLPLLAGCGPTAKVREAGRDAAVGVVNLDGTPLKGGSITFISVKDPMYRSAVMIRSDGHFSADAAPAGDVLVAVETESAKIGDPANYVPIPLKYGNVKTSGLTATVAKGEPLTFELKSK
jgi:hypothetical protein